MKIISLLNEKPYIGVLSFLIIFTVIGCFVVGPTAFFKINNPKESEKKDEIIETFLGTPPAQGILRDMIQHQIMH